MLGRVQAGEEVEITSHRKPIARITAVKLADEVEIEAAPGVLTIRPSAHPRAGWAEAASSFQPEGLIDEMSPTRFDEEEWSW